VPRNRSRDGLSAKAVSGAQRFIRLCAAGCRRGMQAINVISRTLFLPPHRKIKIGAVIILLVIACFWPSTYSPGRIGLIYLVDSIADYVLTHVEIPLDFELPVTTAGYPSSPHTAAVIGGRGHGLDCSLPWFAPYAFRPGAVQAPIAFRFRQACAFHDLCYRHGLATYGYLQNDCDELLQEHAFRICRYVFRKDARIDYCRVEAKKITLAVRLGGTDSFQGWGHSTFYEFDPFPIRSNRFSVARLLTRDADDPRGGQGLDLVRFDVTRAHIRANCVDCEGPAPSKAAIVPLAPDGVYAAPQLVTDIEGRTKLAFVTRRAASTTEVLLANGIWSSKEQVVTLKTKAEGSDDGQGGRDLFGSTVYAIDPFTNSEHRDAVAFVTPSVACKADGRLSLYGLYGWWSGTQVSTPPSCGEVVLKAAPSVLSQDRVLSEDRYRLFQHPPLIDSKRHRMLLLKRGTDGIGSGYNERANVILINFPGEQPETAYEGTLLPGVPLRELHEPIVLLPEDGPAAILLSLVAPLGDSTFSIAETPLDLAQPQPISREIVIDGHPSHLPQDWIDRSPLLLRDGETSHLLLSRTATPEVSPKVPHAAFDPNMLRLDVLLLRREQGGIGQVRWMSLAASRCEITYRLKEPDPKIACRRSHAHQSPLPTAVNRLRASQTLAGDRRGVGASDVIVIDPCLKAAPVVLEPAQVGDRPYWDVKQHSGQVDGLARDTVCRPATRSEIIAPGVR